ncbi:hypothetical protein GSS88_02365 [Corynebacterium sp. 3HC-13]|uniref:DUF732 domain-containing protein n=1 Tax=Corynebacterium poyangense TaxID=2684405 RepID=UPI001CC9F90B|nr:DUF732 domain-containing protein [Corynebacterium poyangense]MBZ8176642.1 hypothetical protein [Corynebacterium poyangense]
MRKLAVVALTFALAGGMAACGGEATVDNQGAPSTTVSPLTRDSSSSSSVSATSSGTNTSRAQEPSTASGGSDRGAREVERIPDDQSRPQQEQKLLSTLKNEGVDVSTLEDTIVATAQTYCQDGEQSHTLIKAIAGQLVEQHRTDKSVDEVAAMIEKAAKNAYC